MELLKQALKIEIRVNAEGLEPPVELSNEELDNIADILLADDYIWQQMNEYIMEEIEKIKFKDAES